MHEDVAVLDNSEIVSKSSIIFEHDGIRLKLADTVVTENHILGSKKVLVDTANKLQAMAMQMKSKAEALR